MPRLFLPGVAIGVLATALTLHARPPQSERGRMLRVMTLNAHAGVDARGRYDLARMAQAIAAADPSVVGLQEMTRNHASYDCEDQPRALAAHLHRITGRPWTQVYVNEWVTKHRQCVDSGRGDDVETEGLALLAPEPIVAVEHVRLWNSRIGLAGRLASQPEVTFIVTHLASNTAGQRDRERQIETLLPWAAGRHGARVLIGDFNATPDSPEMQPVFAKFHDAWADASSKGAASRSGDTHKGWRIDYVLYTPPDALAPERVEVLDTSSFLGIAGPEISDHRPVVASFRVDVR